MWTIKGAIIEITWKTCDTAYDPSPGRAEAGGLPCWVYSKSQKTETKREETERGKAQPFLCYWSELTSVISSLPPPSSSFPSTSPPFPPLSPLPPLLPFLCVHNLLQLPWVRAYRLWLLVSAPFILKISTSKLSWGLCRLQWIIWEQCSINRNLSAHVTYYISICHRTESHHTWHCCVLFMEKYLL